MAEGEGFEPPEALPPQRFSRPPQSTALPSLRGDCKSVVTERQDWRERVECTVGMGITVTVRASLGVSGRRSPSLGSVNGLGDFGQPAQIGPKRGGDPDLPLLGLVGLQQAVEGTG